MIVFVLSLSFVFAASNLMTSPGAQKLTDGVISAKGLSDKNTTSSNATEKNINQSNKLDKNMTYGQCVSEFANLKNQCYSSAKNLSANCTGKDSVNLSSEQKAACKADVKKSINQCKLDFKAAKQECKKIKHNFIETLSVAFK